MAKPAPETSPLRKFTFVKAKVVKPCSITGNPDPETGALKTFLAKAGDVVTVCSDTLRNLTKKGKLEAV